jgi:hypothetical protein
MSEPQNATFLTEAVMAGGDWRALELAVSRLLLHCGWKNIQYVGESGDKGADVLAVRANPRKGLTIHTSYRSRRSIQTPMLASPLSIKPSRVKPTTKPKW